MKTFAGVLLAAACFVACANSFPGAFQDDSDEGYYLVYPGREIDKSLQIDPFDSDPLDSLPWMWPNWYNRMRDMLKKLVPWPTNPGKGNTTSTTNIIDGHVVTINETNYSDGNEEFGVRIRVRVIDVKPENETIPQTEREPNAVTQVTSTQEEHTTPARSVETLEEFDNDIPKTQVDTLAA